MSIKPGHQPVATDTAHPWCCTCLDTVDPKKPHDLVQDCMPRLDEVALMWARKRDEAGAVVLEQMHKEAKSSPHGAANPARRPGVQSSEAAPDLSKDGR